MRLKTNFRVLFIAISSILIPFPIWLAIGSGMGALDIEPASFLLVSGAASLIGCAAAFRI
jgi:hypothetical protein